MTKNLGEKVSRVLESRGRNYSSVIYQQKRPPLDSEFNLMQDIQSEKMAEILRHTSPSGFLDLGPIMGSPEDRNMLSASWRNAIKFKNPIALVNGWIIHVGGGTNQVQENSLQSIWHEISGDENEIAFILPHPPTTAHRQDLVFLEVWLSHLKTKDDVNKDGFVQSSFPLHLNDMIDPKLEIETSQRVQIQYRFRSAEGIDFESFREGLEHPGAKAQGPMKKPHVNYSYRKHNKDPGLYITGDGSENSQKQLGTVDGFIYALPICRVHRRNKIAYSLSNQNGSAYSMLSGEKSDRADGLYNDDISGLRDIEDLRHKVSLTGFDLSTIMEKSIYDMWSRKIPGELKRSSLDENVVGKRILQVDAISGSAVVGADTSNRVPDGMRRSFTEAKAIQKMSLSINNASVMDDGSLWLTPLGHKDNTWEYEWWDEFTFYSRKIEGVYRPRVFTYDSSTGVRTEISGGTWNNIGEFRTYDYTTDVCKNKIQYIPSNGTVLRNKNVVIMMEFISREGGGINATMGGFNFHIENILKADNLKDNRSVEFNHYKNNSSSKSLLNTRKIGSVNDSALTRSITRFEQATITTNNFAEIYKGGCIEIKYNVLSTGSSTIRIPSEVYGRTVAGIYSVYNVTTQTWLIPSITKITTGFENGGIISSADDVIEFTLLCGNYTTDFIPHTRGIKEIASNFVLTTEIKENKTEYVINAKDMIPQCDATLANVGFFNGVQNKFVAFINNSMVFLEKMDGFGTPVITFTLSEESINVTSGKIDIYFLGYYSPVLSDKLVFQYEHTPYRGIIKTRMSGNETERFKIIKIDDKISVTSAGTGSESQLVSDDILGLVSTLPINPSIREYNFFGSNIESPVSGGQSSLRRVPGRGGAKDSHTENSSPLYEGQIITLGLSSTINMLRGAIIKDPAIHERGYDLDVPQIRDALGNLKVNPETGSLYNIIQETDMTAYNHVTQWSAIVESLDSFKGELFLMVITTTSTVYNDEEGLEHEYLLDKDLFRENAFGKGKETILKSGIFEAEINQRLGKKIIGAVDIIPLEGRPLIKP